MKVKIEKWWIVAILVIIVFWLIISRVQEGATPSPVPSPASTVTSLTPIASSSTGKSVSGTTKPVTVTRPQ